MPSYLRCAEIENKRVELPVELNTEAELTREIARLRAELARNRTRRLRRPDSAHHRATGRARSCRCLARPAAGTALPRTRRRDPHSRRTMRLQPRTSSGSPDVDPLLHLGSVARNASKGGGSQVITPACAVMPFALIRGHLRPLCSINAPYRERELAQRCALAQQKSLRWGARSRSRLRPRG